MTLGKKDKAVIEAFTQKRSAVGLKLSSTGERLDGHWMGGNNIAQWGRNGDYIYLNDLGSRAAQTVHRAVKKMAPKKVVE